MGSLSGTLSVDGNTFVPMAFLSQMVNGSQYAVDRGVLFADLLAIDLAGNLWQGFIVSNTQPPRGGGPDALEWPGREQNLLAGLIAALDHGEVERAADCLGALLIFLYAPEL